MRIVALQHLGDDPDEAGALSESIPKLSTFTDAQISARHNCTFWESISTY
jgi:hypothetical protein